MLNRRRFMLRWLLPAGGLFGVVLCGLLQTAAWAQTLTPDDESQIQALSASYAQALGSCAAEAFAELFAPATGYFASGFRGHFEGREQLVKLVQSERHCTAASPPTPRPGGNTPVAEIYLGGGGVHGIVRLGTAEYQDDYVKTSTGWRFAARTVLLSSEKEAGLDAQELLAINRLGGRELVEYYENDANGTARLMTVGTRITVVDGEVTGRVFLAGGGYRDETYERIRPGQWRIK